MLSVIIPSYNEEQNIEKAANETVKLLEKEKIEYEIIFVDDGSSDRTYEKICACAEKNSRIKGVGFSRNFGKEAAMCAGLDEAEGDCAVITDCDLQFPVEKIAEMYSLWLDGYEVVEGIKESRGKEPFFYRLFAKSFYKLMSGFVGVDMQSTSDFKLIDRKVIDALTALPERNTFFRALSFWAGFKSTQVTFEVREIPYKIRGNKYYFLYNGASSAHNRVRRNTSPVYGGYVRADSYKIFARQRCGGLYNRNSAAAVNRRLNYDGARYNRRIYRRDL